ncbi:GNAT family N-acetyltransferase [Paenibacillus thermotolerans]|uniref:GNAT family N-acetyltransferase n=1 Tax=Paenibacillus thermotolerans TaxID=3027807 RepID=UPI002368E290|nr:MULTISPECIES: GNAT family N-acetyltransferase [unclassified Paenibacillus]
MTTSIRMKSLLETTIGQAVQVWNEGFSDYYIKMPITPQVFASLKFGIEEIDPELSFIAFADHKPAGFLLSAFRDAGGEKTAWNGGTAVLPEFRRLGVGKALMAKALESYRERGVGTALLEAFEQNERAIALYRSFGYEVADMIHSFAIEGEAEPEWGEPAHLSAKYDIVRVTPRELSLLPFYPKLVAWQTQWRSGRDGEAVIVSDRASGETVGYALFRRLFDAQGAHTATTLLQAVAAPESGDEEAVLRAALHYVFSARSEAPVLRRSVFGAPSSQPALVSLCESLGFTLRHKLVHMTVKP